MQVKKVAEEQKQKQKKSNNQIKALLRAAQSRNKEV